MAPHRLHSLVFGTNPESVHPTTTSTASSSESSYSANLHSPTASITAGSDNYPVSTSKSWRSSSVVAWHISTHRNTRFVTRTNSYSPTCKSETGNRPDAIPRWTNHRRSVRDNHRIILQMVLSGLLHRPPNLYQLQVQTLTLLTLSLRVRSGSDFGAGNSTTYITCLTNDCKDEYPNQAPSELSISVFLRHRAIEVIQLLGVCVT
ncbi:hypothetical protein M405DRAFT_605455 [Rhizopogon salebrosus TDB-379]|nr:hypothetical protein M405DRAFT_605455 [Rhizopogon salebrosus TDB-379]